MKKYLKDLEIKKLRRKNEKNLSGIILASSFLFASENVNTQNTSENEVTVKSFLFAEESGFFLGVGLGFQDWGWKDDYDNSSNGRGLSGSLYLGYKTMYNKYMGGRIYLSYDYNQAKIAGSNTNSSYDIYALNGDWILNISKNFGLFFGFGAGFIQWDKEIYGSESFKFYANVALGFRFIVAYKHALEIGFKAPFTNTKVVYQLAGINFREVKIRQNYNLGLRYIYTF